MAGGAVEQLPGREPDRSRDALATMAVVGGSGGSAGAGLATAAAEARAAAAAAAAEGVGMHGRRLVATLWIHLLS